MFVTRTFSIPTPDSPLGHSSDHGWYQCHDRREFPASPLQRRQQVSSLISVVARSIRLCSFSSDEETDETVISPDTVDAGWEWNRSEFGLDLFCSELAPSLLSALPRDNFPLLHVEYTPFFQSIEENINAGRHYHHIDLLVDYIDELTKHASTLWSVLLQNNTFHRVALALALLRSNEMRTMFTKLFDSLLDYVQYSTSRYSLNPLVRSNLFLLAEMQANHLRACLCYVEIALGSSKSDLSEDSIERYGRNNNDGTFSSRVFVHRFSCFARLKLKFKSLGYCFARLQFFLYRMKTSAIQEPPLPIDDILYRSNRGKSFFQLFSTRSCVVLWTSSLYYFLSDVQDDALACIYQLQHLLPESLTIILPNLTNHAKITKSN